MMRIGGESLSTIRTGFLLVVMVFVGAIFSIFSKSGSPLTAMAWTVASIAWSVSAYFAAVPSWWVLLFGMFSLTALVHFEQRWWGRFLTGVFAGCGFACKITGVYFLVAAGLALLMKDPRLENEKSEHEGNGMPWAIARCSAMIAGGGVFLSQACTYFTPFEHCLYSVPIAVLLSVALRKTIASRALPPRDMLARDLRLFAPLLGGFLVPVFLLLAPYSIAELPRVIHGMFNVHFRLSGALRAVLHAPTLSTILVDGWIYALPIACSLTLPVRWFACIAIMNTVQLALLASSYGPNASGFSVQTGLYLLPSSLSVLFFRASIRDSDEAAGDRTLAMLACYAPLASMIQFPYSTPVYFLFHFPFTLILLFQLSGRARRSAAGMAAGSVLAALGVLLVSPAIRVSLLGLSGSLEALADPRGGIVIPGSEADAYTEMLAAVRSRAGDSSYIFAGPSRPDIYFLSGKSAPAGSLFDDVPGYEIDEKNIAALIDQYRISVAVISKFPLHRDQYSPAFFSELSSKLPFRGENEFFEIYSRHAP